MAITCSIFVVQSSTNKWLCTYACYIRYLKKIWLSNIIVEEVDELNEGNTSATAEKYDK